MRSVLIAVFTTLLALSIPAAAQSQLHADDDSAVKKVLGDYKAALERLDLSGVEQLFAGENQVIENGKVEGAYADYLAHHIGPELDHFRSFSFSGYNITVRGHGDIAWATETYRYTIVLKNDGKVIERQGVATSVLHRNGAGWRIVSMHSSSRAPKPSPAPAG